VFEVLGPGTGRTGRIIKNRECRAMPAIRRHMMLEQDEAAATVFERAGGDWVGHVLGADNMLLMPEIGVELPTAEFYEDVAFDEGTASA